MTPSRTYYAPHWTHTKYMCDLWRINFRIWSYFASHFSWRQRQSAEEENNIHTRSSNSISSTRHNNTEYSTLLLIIRLNRKQKMLDKMLADDNVVVVNVIFLCNFLGIFLVQSTDALIKSYNPRQNRLITYANFVYVCLCSVYSLWHFIGFLFIWRIRRTNFSAKKK